MATEHQAGYSSSLKRVLRLELYDDKAPNNQQPHLIRFPKMHFLWQKLFQRNRTKYVGTHNV